MSLRILAPCCKQKKNSITLHVHSVNYLRYTIQKLHRLGIVFRQIYLYEIFVILSGIIKGIVEKENAIIIVSPVLADRVK